MPTLLALGVLLLAGCSSSSTSLSPTTPKLVTWVMADPSRPEIEQEQRELEGTWLLEYASEEGRDYTATWEIRILRFERTTNKGLMLTEETVDGSQVRFYVGLGSRRKPNHCDLWYIDGSPVLDEDRAKKGLRPIHRIYEIFGENHDDLMIVGLTKVFSPDRPQAIEPWRGSGQWMCGYRKQMRMRTMKHRWSPSAEHPSTARTVVWDP